MKNDFSARVGVGVPVGLMCDALKSDACWLWWLALVRVLVAGGFINAQRSTLQPFILPTISLAFSI
jgi:hypothetical protein